MNDLFMLVITIDLLYHHYLFNLKHEHFFNIFFLFSLNLNQIFIINNQNLYLIILFHIIHSHQLMKKNIQISILKRNIINMLINKMKKF